MKTSLAIFRVLAVSLLIAFSVSTYQAVQAHDSKAVSENIATAFVLTPFAFKTATAPFHKKSEWRKDGPMVCVELVQVGAPANRVGSLMNPRILGNFATITNQGNSGDPGVATAINGGDTVSTQQIFADFAIGSALRFRYTMDDTYGGEAIPLLPQFASDALPGGVTFSSNTWDSFEEMADYYSKFPHLFDKVTVSTNDTDFFDNEITLTLRKDDGNQDIRSASWNDIARDPYAQDDTVRVFERNFVSGLDMRYEIEAVVPGAGLTNYVAFSFNIVGGSRGATIARARA